MAARSVELGWVRIFAEVGRLGSLSSAATALGLTQPAVSYQIRRLEEQMGASLLHRRHRGVELTPEGRRLFDIAAKTVDEVDSLVQSLRTETDRPTIRLRTDYAFSALWLIPRMHSFRLLYPEMDIQIVATQRLERGFRDDGDVAVAFGSSAEFGVDGTLLLKEKVAPVCTPGFLDRNGPFDDPRRLARSALIHLDTRLPSPWFDWRGYLAGFDVGRDAQAGAGDISFNTYSLVIQAVLGGQGLALGWIGLVDPLLSARLLTTAGPPLESPDRGYWLLSPKSSSAHADRLTTWLIDEAATSSA